LPLIWLVKIIEIDDYLVRLLVKPMEVRGLRFYESPNRKTIHGDRKCEAVD